MGRQKISKEQWLEIIKRIKDNGEVVSDVAKEYGISVGTIYKRLGSSSDVDSSVLEISRLKREIKAWKELVGNITYELNKEKKLL